ncbi:hypothetical protein B0A49_00073 [Cryomyces minteri]|uniref:ADF-H domain-containing protein n=1 Tax=Cryomyces minteri TaxID=331657 RepID=A0A4U0XWQ1_9PEZI|nr:hypothetical protein B0A49_00073 [Cryomyces minteri]
MSLNGLDTPAVNGAYQTTLTEAGGWFLLKYISRDEVEILDRGNGGALEARSAIAQYTEKSPIYGLLLYRRKRVLIKYIPDGTSRLLQARTAVHFQDVEERFSPHETLLEISSPDSLSDSALAAAFPLHTASPSTSSSRLHEISEDAEESQLPRRTGTVRDAFVAGVAGPRRSPEPRTEGSSVTTITPAIQITDEQTAPMVKSRTSVSQILVQEDKHHTSVTSLRTPSVTDYAPSEASLKEDNFRPISDEDTRHPSQTTRTSTSNFYTSSYFGLKPKIKLGPRPMTDKNKRSQTFAAGSPTRPISVLPASMRTSSRKVEIVRPKLQGPPAVSEIIIPPPPPVPDIPDVSMMPTRPVSRGSTRSVPASRSNTMTPENARLQKALELRKKQLRKSAAADSRSAVYETTIEPPLPATVKPPQASSNHVVATSADSGIEIEYSDPSSIKHQSSTQFELSHINLGNPFDPKLQPPRPSPSEQRSSKGDEAGQEELISDAANDRTGNPRNRKTEADRDSTSADRRSEPEVRSDDKKQAARKFEPQKQKTADRLLPDSASLSASPRVSTDSKEKRRGIVEPLHLDVSEEESDFDYLSDDSFMEELQSATVQQAKPVSVSKSPATPFISCRPSSHSIKSTMSVNSVTISKSFSDQTTLDKLDPDRLSPEDARPSTARSVSFTRTPERSQDPMAVAKRVNVSSGISRRIQALAEVSNHHHTPLNHTVGPPRPLTPDSSPPYPGLRVSSLRQAVPRGSASVSSQRPLSRLYPSPSPSPSPSAAMVSPQSPPARNDTHTMYSFHPEHGRRESVSVTARIIRDHRLENPLSSSQTEPTQFELHQSPLTIDHHKASAPSSPRKHGVSRSESMPVLSSDLLAQEATSPPRRTSTESSWYSVGRRPSEAKQPTPTVASLSSNDLASIDEPSDGKKGSRTSRLFKRMSGMTGAKRRSMAQIMSPTVREEPVNLPESAPLRQPFREILVGDLNVQFPDTLLWKRRWVEIDGRGNIVLGLSKSNTHQKAVTKKYHLSEFRRPFAPDQDRQELANSVILDFVGGSTLQIACEDAYSQGEVLKVLQDAHKTWTT